jgi:hypothetical protein
MANIVHLIAAMNRVPTDLPWRDKVCWLTVCSLSELPQNVTPVEHHFEPGLYIRTIRIPKDTILTGREHLRGHLMQLVEGMGILVAPDGNFRFEAPAEMTSKPGFCAVFYAETDVVVRTLHPNLQEIREVDALEAIWFAPAADMIDRGRLLQQRFNEDLPCLPL